EFPEPSSSDLIASTLNPPSEQALEATAVSSVRPFDGEIEGKPQSGPLRSEPLRQAYAECARTVRDRARNFYHGLRLTPEPRRSAIYSIYAWMRAADDLADAPVSAPERRRMLAEFRARTERVLRGDQPGADAPRFWPAFGTTTASYPIDPAIF